MIRERVLIEVRAVLDEEREGIRRLIRDVLREELQRLIREELDNELQEYISEPGRSLLRLLT